MSLSKEIGIDLGTANILIYAKGKLLSKMNQVLLLLSNK